LVILSRGHAAAALAWSGRVTAKLGPVLNATKTAIRDARRERLDFLGDSFGPHHYRKDGHWCLGASPSQTSVLRLKAKLSDILVPGNMATWLDVGDRHNRLLRGWSTYFCHGTRRPAHRAVDNHVYDRVRHFLVRRHKLPSDGTRRFPREAVFWRAGSIPPSARPSGTAAARHAMKPVGKPDAGDLHVRFDERCALQAR
jgi:RNA-directed DNA polymerase